MGETEKTKSRIKRLRKALDAISIAQMDLAMPMGPKVTAAEVADRVADLVSNLAANQELILRTMIEMEKARLRGEGETGPEAGGGEET